MEDREEKMKILRTYCLKPGGCSALTGKTEYDERKTLCSRCNNYLLKIDFLEIIQELQKEIEELKNSDSNQSSPRIKNSNPTGKSTELNKADIRRILTMYADGYTINKIHDELHCSNTTVKNVVNQSFKNEKANEKVRLVIEEMKNDRSEK